VDEETSLNRVNLPNRRRLSSFREPEAGLKEARTPHEFTVGPTQNKYLKKAFIFFIILLFFPVIAATCEVAAAELKIKDLNIFQAQAQPEEPNFNPITIAFRVHNTGSTSYETFTTSIYVDRFNLSPEFLNIDTAPVDNKPSIIADESLYFSWTIIAPSTGQFTVYVGAGGDQASKTSSIDSPPQNQWYWIGPTSVSDYDSAGHVLNTNAGQLLEVAIAPTNPAPDTTIMYTRGEQAAAGIWKSTNGGFNWKNISLSLPDPNNAALAIDPKDAQRVYALSFSDGLYRSLNGGISWKRIADPSTIPGSGNNPSFVISPKKDPRVLFFAPKCMQAQCPPDPREGVYRSTDGGYTWIEYLGKTNGITAARPSTALLDPNDGDILYVGLQHSTDNTVAGLYRTKTATYGPSSDWKRIGQCAAGKLNFNSGDKAWLAFTKTNPALLYVVIENSSGIRLYKATRQTCVSVIGNDDELFEEITVKIPPPIQVVPLVAFTVNPTDNSKMFIGSAEPVNADIMGSTNEGKDWANIVTTPHPDLKSFAWDTSGCDIDPTLPGPTLFVASDGGLHASCDNGGSWTLASGDIQNMLFYHLAQDSNYNVFGGTQDNGTMRPNQKGFNWLLLGGGDGSRVAAQAFDDIEYLWENAGLIKIDHGSKLAFGQGLPPQGCTTNVGGLPTADIHVPIGFQQVYVTCNGSLYWRPDDQLTKEECSKTTSPTPPRCQFQKIDTPDGGAFRSLYDPFSRRFFVGTTTGQIFGTSGIPDRGTIWTSIFPALGTVTDLGFGANPVGTLFVATSAGHVYRLTTTQDAFGRVQLLTSKDITCRLNCGTRAEFDLPANIGVNALANHAGDIGNTVYAGTNDGVFVGTTSDGGDTYSWTAMRDGMGPNVDVTGLILYTPPGTDLFLAASTYGRSVFVTKIRPF
jgi:hypothetical protein